MDKEDVVHIYNGMLLRHKKEKFPFATIWMKLRDLMHSEISQIEDTVFYRWNIKKKNTHTNEYSKANRLIKNKLVVTSREREGGEARKGKEIKRYRLLCMI